MKFCILCQEGGGRRKQDGGRGGVLRGVWRRPGGESGTGSSGRNSSHKQAKPCAHEGGLVGWLGKVGHSGSVMLGKSVKKGGNENESQVKCNGEKGK